MDSNLGVRWELEEITAILQASRCYARGRMLLLGDTAVAGVMQARPLLAGRSARMPARRAMPRKVATTVPYEQGRCHSLTKKDASGSVR